MADKINHDCMDLIDRRELLSFPHSPEAGTDEVIMDLAWQTLPHDIVMDNDQYILDFGWAVIDAMLNVVRTAERVEA